MFSGVIKNTEKANAEKLSIAALSLAAFVIVTTEFIIIGLIPALARDLAISVPVAGQLVTVFAVTVVIAGPPLTALCAKVERRALFTWILIIFALSNAAVALAPGYWTLMLARIAPAVLLPVFWGVGSDAAGQIVSGRNTGKAISQVYFGVTAALLFGLPAGTLLGDAFGWRGTFWLLAALSLIMAVFVRVVMPALYPEKNQSFKSQIIVLRSRYFLSNLLLSLVVFSAMFGAYTYLADMLEKVAGILPSSVGWWLMGFGAVGLIGNYIAGILVDKHAVMAGVIFCLLLGSGSALAVLFVHKAIIFIPSLIAWGIAHTALFPLCQIRVINAAESGKALAGTMNISACNCGIALGAVSGGWLIELSGITAAILGASILIFVCAIAYPRVDKMKSGSRKS